MPIMSHQNILTGTPVPSAESVLAASPVNNVNPVTTQKVIIRATFNLTAGVATTAVVARIRQGNGVGGNIVGAAATVTLAAGNNGGGAIAVEDNTNWLAAPANGGQYCLTLAQTSGTGNGAINIGDLQVEAVP
jgi:hypothetical protein